MFAPALSPLSAPAIQRSPLDAEIDQALAARVSKPDSMYGKDVLDPSHADYPYLLQDYAYGLLRKDPSDVDPQKKPKDATAQKVWARNIDKALLVAKRILNSSAGKSLRESRAGLIADDLIHLGFAEKAMEIVDLLTDKDARKFRYEGIVKNPGDATGATLEKIAGFMSQGSANDNEFTNLLSADLLANFNVYTDSQLLKIFTAMIVQLEQRKTKAAKEKTAAGKDPDKLKTAEAKERDVAGHKDVAIEALTRVLVVKKGFRKLFSTWAWNNNQQELLMDILYKEDSDEKGFFNEPDYGQLSLELTKPDGATRETFILGMSDMDWVYENKQKYMVAQVISLVHAQLSETLKPPNTKADGRFEYTSFRNWLDTNAEKIGAALKKAHPSEPEKIAAFWERIADMAFHHVDRGDVKPDTKKIGSLGHLPGSDPSAMRIKADCDVLALFASRLLFASGFTPIGFMAILPKDAGYVGHAAALLKHGGDFYIAENKQVFKISATTKEDAIKRLRTEIFNTISNAAGPKTFEIYYGDVEFVEIGKDPDKVKRVKAPDAVYDTQQSARRTDLETP